MRGYRSSLAVVVLVPVILSGCQTISEMLGGPGPDCPKSPVEAVLHVDGSRARSIWGRDLQTGQTLDVRPRPVLGWIVDPTSPERVIDASGDVVTFSGEIFRQACFDDSTGVYYIGPEDLPDPNRPPN